MRLATDREFASAYGPRLSGIAQKMAISLWLLITIVSLISLALSIYSLYLWDSVPAADSPRNFSEMTSEDIQALIDWQHIVLQAGFSLSGYAFIFTAARLIGGIWLFTVGFLLVRRYSDRWMAMLMATLLSVFAAAGIWNNPLFGWAVSRAHG
jgi:hypothetical protein